MDTHPSRSSPRPCGLCGHDIRDHATGSAQRSRYCEIETCDCGEYISPLPFGRRWKWSDAEIRRNLQRIAGFGHLHEEPAHQELEWFAFGDTYIVDLRKVPKHKSNT